MQFPEEEWDAVSQEAQDFINQCCVLDPENRISVMDAFKHPWIGLEPPSTKREMTDEEIKTVTKPFLDLN